MIVVSLIHIHNWMILDDFQNIIKFMNTNVYCIHHTIAYNNNYTICGIYSKVM